MTYRSLLYVPAHVVRFVARAHERGADAIILDLEDSVPEADKDAARSSLAKTIASVTRENMRVFVRVNAGERLYEDALAACRASAFGLFIPKVRNPEALEELANFLTDEEAQLRREAMPFIALLEDPAALQAAPAIARVDRVLGLLVGGEDLALALGATPSPEVLRLPKLLVHYAAKAAGKLSLGLLQSVADYADTEVLALAAAEARDHGFDGATCIHPSAVPILNKQFSPGEEELAWANRVLAAAGDTSAPFSLDGRMIDRPVLARAKKILSL